MDQDNQGSRKRPREDQEAEEKETPPPAHNNSGPNLSLDVPASLSAATVQAQLVRSLNPDAGKQPVQADNYLTQSQQRAENQQLTAATGTGTAEESRPGMLIAQPLESAGANNPQAAYQQLPFDNALTNPLLSLTANATIGLSSTRAADTDAANPILTILAAASNNQPQAAGVSATLAEQLRNHQLLQLLGTANVNVNPSAAAPTLNQPGSTERNAMLRLAALSSAQRMAASAAAQPYIASLLNSDQQFLPGNQGLGLNNNAHLFQASTGQAQALSSMNLSPEVLAQLGLPVSGIGSVMGFPGPIQLPISNNANWMQRIAAARAAGFSSGTASAPSNTGTRGALPAAATSAPTAMMPVASASQTGDMYDGAQLLLSGNVGNISGIPSIPQRQSSQALTPAQATSTAALVDAAVAAASEPAPSPSHKDSVLLYSSADDTKLSPYQCLARQQLEFFPVKREDLEAGAQGRNRPIVLGQVGIRCRHCAQVPHRQKQRASTYFPAKLAGVYQTAQNITNSHLCQLCPSVPANIRRDLVLLQSKKSGAGGGRKYWTESAEACGIMEVEGRGLRFRDNTSFQEDSKPAATNTNDLPSGSPKPSN